MPKCLTDHIDSKPKFGARLKKAREKAGLSQRQLSFPGCTAAYISRLEAGARVPSLQMVHRLASCLDVHDKWLAKGKGPMMLKTQPRVATANHALSASQKRLLAAFHGAELSAAHAKLLRGIHDTMQSHKGKKVGRETVKLALVAA